MNWKIFLVAETILENEWIQHKNKLKTEALEKEGSKLWSGEICLLMMRMFSARISSSVLAARLKSFISYLLWQKNHRDGASGLPSCLAACRSSGPPGPLAIFWHCCIHVSWASGWTPQGLRPSSVQRKKIPRQVIDI